MHRTGQFQLEWALNPNPLPANPHSFSSGNHVGCRGQSVLGQAIRLDCQHDLGGWFLVPSVVAGDATVLAQG